MKNKNYDNLFLLISAIVISISCFISINATVNDDPLFYGLQPKARYNGYKIYDLIEQRGLACAQAIEILDSDDEYVYYFNCLKSDKIYLTKDSKRINVKDAYKRGIITKERLYELNIVDRMNKR